MKKRLLVLDDDPSVYLKIQEILDKFEIETFPSTDAERKSIVIALRKYGDYRTDRHFSQVKAEIDKYIFDFVLLDISLTNSGLDEAGFDIKKKILDAQLTEDQICFITNRNDPPVPNCIDKKDLAGFEVNLYEKVVRPIIGIEDEQLDDLDSDSIHKFPETQNIYGALEKIIANLKKSQADTNVPKWLTKLAGREKYKILPTISFFIDVIIRYCFYVSLIVLFVYAPVFLFWAFKDYRAQPIQIAEYSFIVFLPFLIACGFYVFYIKSLRPYIVQNTIHSEDFIKPTLLMQLSKKLFVSSLLSYLFIKFIELLQIEKTEKSHLLTYSSSFQKYYNLPPVFQLICVGCLIVTLIFYYIYIDKAHHDNGK